jgi:hypothetical protein
LLRQPTLQIKGSFTEMSRKSLYQVSALVVLITIGLLIALFLWRQKMTQTVLIGQEQAIQNASQACPSIGLQPVEQPTEFQAELTTYRNASNDLTNPPDSEKPVWVVKMKGRWILMRGPPPEDPSNAEPAYWDECIIIIDAQTGESLSYPIE